MSDSQLPLEKQLLHRNFCQLVADVKDVNVAREMLRDLHLKYLSDQAAVLRIARNDFWRDL